MSELPEKNHLLTEEIITGFKTAKNEEEIKEKVQNLLLDSGKAFYNSLTDLREDVIKMVDSATIIDSLCPNLKSVKQSFFLAKLIADELLNIQTIMNDETNYVKNKIN